MTERAARMLAGGGAHPSVHLRQGFGGHLPLAGEDALDWRFAFRVVHWLSHSASLGGAFSMQVICRTNELAALHLSAYHRSFFERYLQKGRPVWAAEVGAAYTVYAISIVRGCPFYCVNVPDGWGGRWGRIPSVCFDIMDPRPSRYWHFDTRVVRSGENEVLHTTLAIPEWISEPTFVQNLVENREREVAVMAAAAAEMDAEFQ